MATNSSKAPVKREKTSTKSYRDMGYREKPATPNSPSGTTVTTMYDHLLSPSSPAEEEEKDDRLRNDLLDEICNDMGIDDSMDLDFDDFCYNGQQPNKLGSIVSGQRFGQVAPKSDKTDSKCTVSSTSSSGYTTSDSLCAIAKLTHSITSEVPLVTDDKQRGNFEAGPVKQEPAEELAHDPLVNMNDTDQGKAAAASKLALQKQMSENSEIKRRNAEEHVASPNDGTEQPSSMNEQISTSPTPLAWHPVSSNMNQQQSSNPRTQVQTCVDYSYQDDFTMEDMTAPDTMINFSEMPQQPNYYQLPQTARDNLSIGFNMSLQQTQHPHQGLPGPQQQSITFARMAFGSPSQHHQANDITMGRSSPHLRAHQHSFQNSTGQISQQQGSTFQSCQGPQPGSSSASSSMQSQSSFQRLETFPGTTGAGSHSVAEEHQLTPALPQHPVPQSPTHTNKSVQIAGVSTASGAAASFNSSQQGFMQRLVTDKSSAFRSHPLFPLLRDLIIADMNFHEPTFPHQLIRDLPSDFNKLLKNYLSRNPPRGSYQSNQSVESVVMDALKYAHHTLIEKISQKKTAEHQGHPAPPRHSSTNGGPSSASSSLNNVNDYCEKFEDSVRQNVSQTQPGGYGKSSMTLSQQSSPVSFRNSRIREPDAGYHGEMAPTTGTYNQPLTVDTGCASPNSSSRLSSSLGHVPASTQASNMYQHAETPPQYLHQHAMPINFSRSSQQANSQQRNPYMHQHGPSCPPPNYTVSPNNPPLSRHQQSMYEMGPPSSVPGLYDDPNTPYSDPYNSCMPPPGAHHHRLHHMGTPDRHLLYMNNINDGNLVKTMMEGGKDMYDAMSDNGSVMSGHSIQGSVKGTPPSQGKPTEGRKHASLPKEAVSIMLNWLREHQDKPYPNDDEKGMLIKQTGLSITQINYWFTNARRRLLPKWRGEDM